MHILGIETTGPIGSAAIMNNSGEIEVRRTGEKMSHLREVSAMIDDLLWESRIRATSLGLITVSLGPGSFTGIRIGLATARALAQAGNTPCKGVSSLKLFREKCNGETGAATIYNARRGQVYGSVYAPDGGEILAPGPYMLEDVLTATEGRDDIVFYGDGVDAYIDRLCGKLISSGDEKYPTADMVIRLGKRLFDEEGGGSFRDLSPDYMRIAEAEQNLKDGTLARMQEEKQKRYGNP